MRKRAMQNRGVRWMRTLALATATCAAADWTIAADGVPPDAPALETNPFFSAGAAPSSAPRAASPAVPAAITPPALDTTQPTDRFASQRASMTAPSTTTAARPSAGLRRLPALPQTAPAKTAPTVATAPSPSSGLLRRLPPPLPASDPEVASLAPTLPLESPAPSNGSGGWSSIKTPQPVPAPKGTNLATIARTRAGEAASPERTVLGELEDYRLDVHDAQLGVVSEQARALVEEGIGLAERGAFFSARSNFVNALRTVAQALDGESRRPVHSEALVAGLEALDEAEDFASEAGGAVVAKVAAKHRTPALTEEQAGVATPNEAMRAYYSFAAEALSRCGGSSEAAAEALFQLGKLQTFLAEKEGAAATAAIPRSTALYHAALAVSPRHARAGNELGFLLAKSGDYAHARAMLQRAVATEPLAEAWHNLAVVHERLGETDLASQARERFSAIAAAQGGSSVAMGVAATPRVTWVAPETMKAPPAEAFPSEKPASPTPVRTASPDQASGDLVR